MERSHAAQLVAELSAGLTLELDGLADRAYALQQQSAALHKLTKATYTEKGVQAATGAATIQHLDRARRLAAFAFQPFEKRDLNWSRIRTLNLDRMVVETDVRSIMELFNDLAHADLEMESDYNLTSSNLIKLVQIAQLQLQYMQWNVEQGHTAIQILQEERSSLVSGLQMIPDMSLAGVANGLETLGNEFSQVGNADLDAMFIQVRTEERTGAADVLLGAADTAKRELAIRTTALDKIAPRPAGLSRVGPIPGVAGAGTPGTQPATMPTGHLQGQGQQGQGQWQGQQQGQGQNQGPGQALGQHHDQGQGRRQGQPHGQGQGQSFGRGGMGMAGATPPANPAGQAQGQQAGHGGGGMAAALKAARLSAAAPGGRASSLFTPGNTQSLMQLAHGKQAATHASGPAGWDTAVSSGSLMGSISMLGSTPSAGGITPPTLGQHSQVPPRGQQPGSATFQADPPSYFAPSNGMSEAIHKFNQQRQSYTAYTPGPRSTSQQQHQTSYMPTLAPGVIDPFTFASEQEISAVSAAELQAQRHAALRL